MLCLKNSVARIAFRIKLLSKTWFEIVNFRCWFGCQTAKWQTLPSWGLDWCCPRAVQRCLESSNGSPGSIFQQHLPKMSMLCSWPLAIQLPVPRFVLLRFSACHNYWWMLLFCKVGESFAFPRASWFEWRAHKTGFITFCCVETVVQLQLLNFTRQWKTSASET